MSISRFTELAAIIADSTAKIGAYCEANSVPLPTFDPSGRMGLGLPPHETELVNAQAQLVSATLELHNLAKGPAEMLMGMAVVGVNEMLGLQAVSRLNIATTVPEDGSGSSYAELSQQCGMNERDLRRLLQHAMTNHILTERDGRVTHTAASSLLAANPNMRRFVELQMEDYFPSACRTLDAIQAYDGIRSPEQSALSLAHKTALGLYDELRRDPARGARFASAMAAFASPFSLEPLGAAFDWAACKLVVDVGGAQGPVSIALARMFPALEFVVQDLAEAVASGPAAAEAAGVGARVRFEVADFLEGQRVRGADVYYFRAVFLNWPDECCVRILRNQVAALERGAHILIEDVVPIDTGSNKYQEKFMRSLDMTMLTYFGGGNRTVDQWKALVAEVDSRLVIKSAVPVPRSYRHLLDVVWDSESQDGPS